MNVLITAGGTREYIDPVRFISNASSGRMGCALAHAALAAGHKVTLITAPVAQEPPRGAKIVKVQTAAEMFEAVKEHFCRCDCLIMAAAVADYTPIRRATTKLKKTSRHLTIKLKPTRDILKWAGKHKSTQVVVGFALEDTPATRIGRQALRAGAEKKLRQKNLDMIVANTPAAIGADKSTVQIKTATSAWVTIRNASKSATAGKIIRMVERLRS